VNDKLGSNHHDIIMFNICIPKKSQEDVNKWVNINELLSHQFIMFQMCLDKHFVFLDPYYIARAKKYLFYIAYYKYLKPIK